MTPLQCDRVYYAGSRGLCLMADAANPAKPGYFAHVFDEHFTRLHSMPLTGPPSRTRISPDGRRAAFTVFDEGHSYADGVFSTRFADTTFPPGIPIYAQGVTINEAGILSSNVGDFVLDVTVKG